MKYTFPKAEHKVLQYRDYKNFIEHAFHSELRERLKVELIVTYDQFEAIFLDVCNRHAPPKKKIVRANHKPYMTKAVRKAIMRRSALENKYYKNKILETGIMFKKQ